MKKRLLSLLLTLCMLSAFVPITERHAEAAFNLDSFKSMALANWEKPIKVNILPVNNGREFGASRNNGTRNHSGMDWIPTSGVIGTPVYAMDSGTVTAYCSGYYAGTDAIAVSNDSGGVIVYGEIAPAVGNGARVTKGQQIGTIKKNNYGIGMLHLELYAGTDSDRIFGFSKYNNINHPYLAVNKNCWARKDLLDPTFLLNCSTYVTAPKPTPKPHTHSWTSGYDSSHPHRKYRTCSGCNSKEYTGGYQNIKSCSSCYPLGNARLTREFNRTSGRTTFYRNNVSNADSYIVNVYQDGRFYDDYKMTDTSRTITLPQGHSYTASMTVKNNNTGQTRSASCSSFRIYNTYNVSYNANGGSGAPSSQTKIQDENLTLSSSKPTKAHYVFKGWASSKTATSAQYQAGDRYTKNAKITLYAVWEPEIYTINFDANGGKGDLENAKITYGNSMRMPNNVVNTGYYLRGWATSKNATEPQYKIGVDYKLEADTTLYAVWGSTGWAQEIADGFAGGDGTEENPYQISNAAELAYLASIVNSQTAIPEYKYYKLTDNINLGYNEWVPIGLYGNDTQLFYGSFDGNGFTISDIYMTEARENYVGLFGYVKDSEIKNLTITGAIENVSSANVLNIGGIAGYTGNTNVSDCNALYFTVSGLSAEINSTYSRAGCMIGMAMGGLISDCKANECSINLKAGNFDAGIVVGQAKADVKNSSVTASENGLFSTVSTAEGVSFGGLCGYLSKTAETCSVSAPYLTNEIQGTSTASYNIGGLVGNLAGELKVCSAQFDKGRIKTINGEEYGSSIYVSSSGGTTFAGGLIGKYVSDTAKITDCKYDGQSVTSISDGTGYGIAGGLVGRMTAKSNPTVSVNGGQTLSRADMPKKDGYKATWYTDPAFKNEYDFSQTVTSDMTLYAKWEEGTDEIDIWDGTSKEPAYNASTKTYTITNGEELAWVSDVTNGVITEGVNFPTDITFSGYTVELANDIYLNDTTGWESWETTAPKNKWKPIGTRRQYNNNKRVFSGKFNGNKQRVSGIYISDNADARGLIGYSDGIILNVGVDKSYVKGNYWTGGICGMSEGTIENCHNSGTIYGRYFAGGVTGTCDKLAHCYNSGTVSGYDYVGGISGSAGSSVSYCHNTGTVSCSDYQAGGICGNYERNGNITYCHNTGKISGGTSVGGISGRIFQCKGVLSYCYNVGSIMGSNGGGIIGNSYNGEQGSYNYIKYCYSTVTPLYRNFNSSYTNTISVAGKTVAQMKNLSNLPGFSTSIWAVNSSINGGYPYLKSMADTYKTYTITAVADMDNTAIKRSFANVDGIVYAESATRGAYAGGIVGEVTGSGNNKSTANGLISIANNISAKTAVASGVNANYIADAGYIAGHNNGFCDFTGAYYNSDILSNGITNTTGTSRPTSALKIPSFLTNLVGLNAYKSLDHLKEDETAVWVIKNGELPELYYNCLKDISVSEDIENGTITANKTQGIDGEVVEITAAPAEGYVLNKAYVNGEEIVGTTFEIAGDSEIYATFIQETPEYTVSLKADENASATLINADEENIETFSLMSVDEPVTTLTAADGEEIAVNAIADEEYTVDAVYVNGEEIVGDNFILTEDTEVTLEISSLSTEIKAVTNDPEFIDAYFAILSGSVEESEENVRYISYWKESEPDEVFVTEAEEGGGDYTVTVGELEPETTYCYQMNDSGEVKTFTTTEGVTEDFDPDEPSQPTEPPTETDTPQVTDIPQETDVPQQTEQPSETDEPIIVPETMPFEIQNAAVNDKVTADIVNISDTVQSGIVIFAAYTHDGKLVSVKCQNIDNIAASDTLPCEFDIPEGAEKYKLLVWNSWKHIIPLAESVEVK